MNQPAGQVQLLYMQWQRNDQGCCGHCGELLKVEITAAGAAAGFEHLDGLVRVD